MLIKNRKIWKNLRVIEFEAVKDIFDEGGTVMLKAVV